MSVRLAVTLGDPRGIGPEVVARAAADFREEVPDAELVFLGADATGDFPFHTSAVGAFDGSLTSAGVISGQAIEEGVQLAMNGLVHGLVTGPIHKPALQAAGYPEPGHTELLQRLTGARDVGMLMDAERTRLGGPLRVLLATTHIALESVPEALTRELLIRQASLLRTELRRGWGLSHPRIALCAVNPHASDSGMFGSQEAEIMVPAVEALRAQGVEVSDPIPADTVFSRTLKGEFDAVVAPYHDVGMAAFKTVSFGTGVNVTLGLPFPRTSPDHGTAFDRVGTGSADPSSTLEALRLAYRLASGASSFDTPPQDV